MLEFLGYALIVMILYSYIGYPIVLILISPFSRFYKKPLESFGSNGISIVIACRNEEKVLVDKIENTLSLNFYGHSVAAELKSASPRVQVIVASDASEDSSHAIVQRYSSSGVQLVASPTRMGKESAQKRALNYVNQEVILFTDAKIKLSGSVLENVLNYFKDPSIGAVSSRDLVIDEYGHSGEGAYVDYEMWLRKLETSVFSLIGLSGSCFAVRKSVTKNFPEGIPSDFCTILEARRDGLRGVHADDVVAEYKAVKSSEAEFERKIRTVVRGMHSVWAYRGLIFSSGNPFLTFQIISHKIMRWLVPIFGIFLFIISSTLVFTNIFWLVVFVSAIFILGMAFTGYLDHSSRSKIWIKLPFFFCLSNLAILVAIWKFAIGDKQVSWNPSDKG